jgi:hypothetical protein
MVRRNRITVAATFRPLPRYGIALRLGNRKGRNHRMTPTRLTCATALALSTGFLVGRPAVAQSASDHQPFQFSFEQPVEARSPLDQCVQVPERDGMYTRLEHVALQSDSLDLEAAEIEPGRISSFLEAFIGISGDIGFIADIPLTYRFDRWFSYPVDVSVSVKGEAHVLFFAGRLPPAKQRQVSEPAFVYVCLEGSIDTVFRGVLTGHYVPIK